MQILIFTKTPLHRRSNFKLSVIMKGFRSRHRLALLIMRVYKEIALFCCQFSMLLPPWQSGESRSGATGTRCSTEKMVILTTLLSGRVDLILFLGIIWIAPQEMRVTCLRKFRMNLSLAWEMKFARV